MAPKRDTTNSGIYDKLESLRLEVKQDIMTAVNAVAVSQGRLEKKFDELEAGRLTRAEANITGQKLSLQKLNDMLIRMNDDSRNAEKTLTNKFVVLGTIGLIILTSMMNAFALKVLGVLK